MNEFERALAKTEKREQRKTLHMPMSKTESLKEIAAVLERFETVTKEKTQSKDGVIEVTISLPYDTFHLRFTKPNVTGMGRLTKRDFEKAIAEGLRPILGIVK